MLSGVIDANQRATARLVGVSIDPWEQEGGFDEGSFREELARLVTSHPHGIYTTGSTGEFYALDWDEFKRMVDVFVSETVGKVPIQVGANWFNTRDTIRRAMYARDAGVDGAQICFPGWMEMRLQDNDQFLEDVYRAVPDIALIHYNVGRARRVFHGHDYQPRPATRANPYRDQSRRHAHA